MNAEEKLAKVARTQYGVFSRVQARNAGFSESAIDRRVNARRWEPVLPGVYRLRGVPETWHQRLMAAQLWAGPDAVLSHRSAAELLGLEGAAVGFIELTIPQRRHAPSGILLHVSNDLARSDCAKLGPFNVTTVTRTCIDLGAVEGEDVVELVTEDALRRRRTTIERLRGRVDGLASKGRRGVKTMKRFLAQRPEGARPTDPGFETRLFQVLRCYKYHSSRSGWERDHKRGNPIVAAGWGILRATWGDLSAPKDFLQALEDVFVSAGVRARS